MTDRPLAPRDEARRRFLLRAMALGLFAGGSGWSAQGLAALFGKVPGKLPEGKSIFDLRGTVLVNGKPADESTVIGPGDAVRTEAGSHVVYAVGDNAFILRENSQVQLQQIGRAAKQALRLITGKLLGVFGKRSPDQSLILTTSTATIGIRGTGAYAESEPARTYLCTCYGTTDLYAAVDHDPGKPGKNAPESVRITASHHDAPKYILSEPDGGKRIIPAPFINHTDLELMTLEALVGRQVPFGLPADEYERPRRDY